MSDAVHGLLGGGWVELEDGAVNVFKVYIGKSNVVKWVTPKGEVLCVSSMGSYKMLEILEKVAGDTVVFVSPEKL